MSLSLLDTIPSNRMTFFCVSVHAKLNGDRDVKLHSVSDMSHPLAARTLGPHEIVLRLGRDDGRQFEAGRHYSVDFAPADQPV